MTTTAVSVGLGCALLGSSGISAMMIRDPNRSLSSLATVYTFVYGAAGVFAIFAGFMGWM